MSEERLRAEGKIDELKGKLETKLGEMTGDERTQAEGKMDEVKGNIKQGAADAKDKLDEAVDNLTNR